LPGTEFYRNSEKTLHSLKIISVEMSEKKKFLLRIDSNVYAALEKWAADELRSINAQIEFLLADAMRKAGRTILNDANINPDKEDAHNP